MPESSKPTYEATPDGLHQRLVDTYNGYPALVSSSLIRHDTASLYLNATTGERLVIQKLINSIQPPDQACPDVDMTVFRGSSRTLNAEHIDFTFGPDGVPRKRVVSGLENGVPLPTETTSLEGLVHIAQLAVHHGLEAEKNRQLAEDMGLNNQPMTTDEIVEAMSYLDGASVLDPRNRYHPVATLDI